jgi:hypothetical protein
VAGSRRSNKIRDTALIKVEESLWVRIWHYCRRVGIYYVVALAVIYAAYSAAKEVIGAFENKAKYEAEYEVYKHSLCDLLSSEGLTNRECGIPLDRRYDPKFPKDLERVLDNALNTNGIKADLNNADFNNAHLFTHADEIFKKIEFHRVAPDGSVIAASEASLTDVSLAVNKYLKR